MSTELQVKTVTLTPAVVEFNFAELSSALDENLKKYDGLTFTEKDAAACKKTITELNKGKKALDSYRKETKKKLTASVTAFENQCKELNQKFDDVINPLKDQHDQFEINRKEEKRQKVNDIISKLINKEDLNDKYMSQLIVKDEYLTKSKTLKSIEDELAISAEHLGIKQDKEEADMDIIKSHVELVNTKNDLNLIDSSYINLLDYQSVEAIKERIETDALNEVEKAQRVVETKVQSKVKKHHEVPVKEESDTNEATFVEVYELTGTESQLDELEEYMSSQCLSWRGIDNA